MVQTFVGSDVRNFEVFLKSDTRHFLMFLKSRLAVVPLFRESFEVTLSRHAAIERFLKSRLAVVPSFHETAHLNPRKRGVRVKKCATAKRDKSITGHDG